MPLAFTDEQLVTIQIIAAPLPPQLLSAFLQALANELEGREVGDGELHRIALEDTATGDGRSSDDWPVSYGACGTS